MSPPTTEEPTWPRAEPLPIPPLCWRHEQEARAASRPLEPVPGCEDCEAARVISAAEAAAPKMPADRLARVKAEAARTEPNEAEVNQATVRYLAQSLARRKVYRAEHAYQPMTPTSGADLVAEDDDADEWRVDGIMPAGSVVILAASAKAGKTTLTLNLIRALLRREPFLGYRTYRPDGQILYLNTDRMPRRIVREWARKLLGPAHGWAWEDADDPSHLDILDPDNRVAFAADLRQHDVAFLVIDSALPLVSSLGLDENSNSDVRKWLDALRPLQDASGVGEILVLHHAGHAERGRSRGASAWADGADVMWVLTHNEDDHSREFSIPGGRGVLPVKLALDFDPASYRYAPDGEPVTQAQRNRNRLAADLLDILAEHGGVMSSMALVEATDHTYRVVMAAVEMLVTLGQVTVGPDPKDKRSKLIALTGRGPNLLASLEAA